MKFLSTQQKFQCIPTNRLKNATTGHADAVEAQFLARFQLGGDFDGVGHFK